MLRDQLLNALRINWLASEIDRLGHQQLEAVRIAVGGMTEAEVREYEIRGKQLAELLEEFKILLSKRTM